MSVDACFLNCFPKDERFLFLTTAQMVGWKFEQLEVKFHKPT